MIVFRIHSPAYDAFDTMGTVLYPGRWHSAGTRVVYTAAHVSLAALEVLVHAGGRKVPQKVLTRIHLPDDLAIEEATPRPFAESQVLGDEWVAQARTPVLRVPSMPANDMESNYVLNPSHPEFQHIRKEPPMPFPFDTRFFSRRLL